MKSHAMCPASIHAHTPVEVVDRPRYVLGAVESWPGWADDSASACEPLELPGSSPGDLSRRFGPYGRSCGLYRPSSSVICKCSGQQPVIRLILIAG